MGDVKIAPGSVTSFATVLLFYFFVGYLHIFSFILIISAIIILSLIAVSSYTEDLIEKDKSEIVIDEVIGQSIALLPLLIFLEPDTLEFFMCVISFLFFRFFDIVKPYPINKFDKINDEYFKEPFYGNINIDFNKWPKEILNEIFGKSNQENLIDKIIITANNDEGMLRIDFTNKNQNSLNTIVDLIIRKKLIENYI